MVVAAVKTTTSGLVTETRLSEAARVEPVSKISKHSIRREGWRANSFGARLMGSYASLHLLMVGNRLAAHTGINSNRLLFYRHPRGDASETTGSPAGELVTTRENARDRISQVLALSSRGLGRRPRREAGSTGKPRVRLRWRTSLRPRVVPSVRTALRHRGVACRRGGIRPTRRAHRALQVHRLMARMAACLRR